MPVVEAISSLESRSAEDKYAMRKSTVCRCLFGKPDHESLKEELNRQLESERLRGKMKWNFDFKKNEPLEGRYQWEATKVLDVAGDYIPDFYTRPQRPTKVRVRVDRVSRSNSFNREDDHDHEILAVPLPRTDVSEKVNTSGDSASSTNSLDTGAEELTNSQGSTRGNLVQSHIDDFMRKRKRRSPSPVENVQVKSPRTE